VNPQNDWVESLTIEDLKKIWEPGAQGTVMKWSDVNPAWPAEDLKLYGPGTDSGTFDYFTGEIVGEEGASRGDYTASEDDNVLVQGIGGDKNSLGYFGYAYYVENQDKLKLVPIVSPDTNQPVEPSEQTINDGTYKPLSRPIFIYVSTEAAARPEIQEFVRYYLTEGTEFISEVGYVPLPDEAYELALQRFEAKTTGSLFNTDAAKGKTVLEVLESAE
jgi:phosphate transport system substrate-binding protein